MGRIIVPGEARTVCDHSKCRPRFDADKTRGMDAHYVRENYPRFSGQCPDCFQNVIVYASFEHYIAGDW